MKVVVTSSYLDSCRVVADMIEAQVKADEHSKLGLATGGTAEQVYACMVEDYEAGKVSFKNVSTVNLDEYIGIDPNAPQSYRNYMNGLFFNKVDIDIDNTFVASGKSDICEEIRLFNEKLVEGRSIDLQLLGVGISGHIGFNEPGEHLIAGVHIESLDESTVKANARFFETEDQVPRSAITMGVGDIMKARSVVLIATGLSKVPAMKALLMNDGVTTSVPATLLKCHAAATVVIDKELADAIGYKN